MLFLQHFTGTLDNWDPAVTDPLAAGREVILFESAGVGRSTGDVPQTIAGMAEHALAFADAMGLNEVDALGFSLGGMVAQEIALERPSLVRRMLLVGTAPEGGEDIMRLEKPELQQILNDPNLRGLQVLVKLFFTSSDRVKRPGKPSCRGSRNERTGNPYLARRWRRRKSRPSALGNGSKASVSRNSGALSSRASS